MKEGTLITKIAMIFIAGVLAVYFGAHLWQSAANPLRTTFAYTYTVNDSVEADGFLVRQEQVISGRSGIVNVTLREGEKVGQGQTVALVYKDDQALRRQEEIRQLELQIELLQYALSQTDEGAGTAELEEDIIQAVLELRADVSAGDFDRLEDQVLELKKTLLKRDYTYGQGGSADQLKQLSSQLRTLTSQASRDTSAVTAERPGTYSAQVDGYESLLTPETAASMTPSQLAQLAEREVQEDTTALGKLITKSTWYFVTAVDQAVAARVSEGETLTVRFTGDFSRDVEMTVSSVGAVEDGQAVLLLSSDRYLADTTLLRQQTVEIIFRQYTGLRIPKAALRMETQTVTDQATGQTTTKTVTGVYAVVNGSAEFKEVETLTEGTQFYVVKPLGSERTMLRAGDEVIVQGKDLYDGKDVT